VESAMGKLESGGQVLRGRFTPESKPPDSEIEWCNRRLLARIHRLTLGRLRKEIEPVTSADFMRFLFSCSTPRRAHSFMTPTAHFRSSSNSKATRSPRRPGKPRS